MDSQGQVGLTEGFAGPHRPWVLLTCSRSHWGLKAGWPGI